MTGQFWVTSCPRMMSVDCSRSEIKTLSKLFQVISILCCCVGRNLVSYDGLRSGFSSQLKTQNKVQWHAARVQGEWRPGETQQVNIHHIHRNTVNNNVWRFWLHGVCKPNMQEKRASEPLSIDQFLSAFLLLVLGTCTFHLIILK